MSKKTKGLVNADELSSFWVNNGPILRNLKDLKDALLNMNQETFSYHVNKEKNDFAVWVKDTLKNNTLAKKLLKTKTVESMVEVINNVLKYEK